MIEIKNVSISYGSFEAVHGANFTVHDGEFFTLLGPSGCGKTTTLRAIAGFEKLTAGQILLDGKDIAPLSPEEREIGFVFQNYALFPSMTVFDNIAFGLKIRHQKKKDIREKVEEIAALIGITEHLPKKISQLSGGQQQRVAIARALILKPRILLMDEPLSNLDAKLRISMRAEIKRIQKELGIVAIYVTHDQEEAMAISDRIAVFDNGCIEQIGTPQEVYYSPKTAVTARFVGNINEMNQALVAEVRQQAGVDLAVGSFIRTEKVNIAGDRQSIPQKSIVCSGRVKEREFLGSTTKTVVDLGNNASLTSLSFDAAAAAEGSQVLVWFSAEDVLVLG